MSLEKSTGTNFREAASGSFIYALDNALSNSVCEEMIARFEQYPEQQYQGRIGQVAECEESIKRSTDLRISGNPHWQDVDLVLRESLSHALGLMAGIHPFFKANRLRDIGYNMQKTGPGEYYHWHVDGGPGEFALRQLVAIWYLNDAPASGGETEFHFQGVSVHPEQGMLLLFPPFWTHVHRGKTVDKGEKYIATTWVCVD